MTTASLVVLGYLLGSCPWGYWIVRLVRHEDIRKVGSGNIGGTNVWRAYGAKLGVPVLFLDFAKGFVPALVGVIWISHLAAILAGGAAMVGHWRPLFLRFAPGGKVIATGAGVFFAIAPLAAGTALLIWIILFWVIGFASLASVVAAIAIPIGAWLYGYPRSVVVFAVLAASLAVYLHRANLGRLFRREETQSGIALIRKLNVGRS
jgi:acyl phosphate:glycerol-3-phosphate acyltransferase